MTKRAREDDDEDGPPSKNACIVDELHWWQLLPVEMRETIWDFLPFRAHLHLSVCCTWLSDDLARRVVVPKGWRAQWLAALPETQTQLRHALNYARDHGVHRWPGLEHLYVCANFQSLELQSFQLCSHKDLTFLFDYGVEVSFLHTGVGEIVTATFPMPTETEYAEVKHSVSLDDALSYLKSLAQKRKEEAEALVTLDSPFTLSINTD